MQTAAKPLRRARLRATNRTKCLLCYIICFSLPLAYQAAMLWLVYPYRLAGTAPGIAANIAAAFPALSEVLSDMLAAADIGAAKAPQALLSALTARSEQWRLFLCACEAAAWLITLAAQLIWRVTHSKPIMAARAFGAAVRSYRLTMLIVLMLNALFASGIWLLGIRFIEGRTVWDYIAYFPAYALNALAALLCSRLAAHPALSGKHAFFRRL